MKRLGVDAVLNIVKKGKGAMPGFPTMNAEAITDVIEFLDKYLKAGSVRLKPGATSD